MSRSGYLWSIIFVLSFSACNRTAKKNSIPETRTSGTTELLVDESFARILDDQIEVFKSDYPDTKITTVLGNENKILPTFLNGKVKMIILSRMLTPGEEAYYKQRQIAIFTDRFAIDGIALITNAANIDSNINANDIFEILKGTSKIIKNWFLTMLIQVPFAILWMRQR